jgi:nitroreductase
MLPLLRKRRSIRKYRKNKIDVRTANCITEALLRSPSSRGTNPWEFIFVSDPVLLARLATAKEHGSEFLNGAALGIIICADSRKSDVWIEDCSIASIVAQLAALSFGIASCWIQIRNRTHDHAISAEEYIRKILALPPYITVESILAMGYPAEKKKPVPNSRLQRSKVHWNGWQ